MWLIKGEHTNLQKLIIKNQSVMANFIEVKVTYRKTLENGSTKKVNELYLADAINVKEAEDRVLQVELHVCVHTVQIGVSHTIDSIPAPSVSCGCLHG